MQYLQPYAMQGLTLAPPRNLVPDISISHQSLSLLDPAGDQDDPQVNASELLCPQCQAIFATTIKVPIFGDEPPVIGHHECFDTYRGAVQQGCWICCNLTAGFEEEQPTRDFRTYCTASSGFYQGLELQILVVRGSQGSNRHYFTLSPADGLKEALNSPPANRMRQIKRWSNECINHHSLCKQYRAAQNLDKCVTPWLQPASIQASLPPFSCLSFYKTTHFLQTSSSDKRGPSRLLNIQSVDNDLVWVQDVRSSAVVPRYATISHRWGNPPPPKLLRSNQAEFATGIKLSTLPKSFRNSIAIARATGLTHVWIDSICIVQIQPGEEEDPEWTQEISNMGRIYASGAFNIAIVASENSEGGCFTNPQQHHLPIVKLAWQTDDDSLSRRRWVVYEQNWGVHTKDVLNPILYGRGWVHQELHLSPATLYCTAKQLWWSCMQYTVNEVFPRDASNKFIRTGELPGDIRHMYLSDSWRDYVAKRWRDRGPESVTRHEFLLAVWAAIVREYSVTTTTVPADRLVAIAGIANQLRRWVESAPGAQPLHYHSGMWSTDVLVQLLWSTAAPGSRWREKLEEEHPNNTGVDNPDYIPTWSWASIKGADVKSSRGSIRIFPFMYGITPVSQVISFPATADSLGRARSADMSVLRLRSRLLPVTWKSHLKVSRIGLSDDPHQGLWSDPEDNLKEVLFDTNRELARAKVSLSRSGPNSRNEDDGRGRGTDGVDKWYFVPLLMKDWGDVTYGLLVRGVQTKEGTYYSRCGSFQASFRGRDERVWIMQKLQLYNPGLEEEISLI